MDNDLTTIREAFIGHWGAMGNAWGINRTMAQIHALLMMNVEPLTTLDVMNELEISRGNANTNLRELVEWGLVRSIVRRGDRKEYFAAEKDVWRIFCIISRERKRREIEPIAAFLEDCHQRATNFETKEGQQVASMLGDLSEFVSLANTVMEKIAESERSKVVPAVMKFFK